MIAPELCALATAWFARVETISKQMYEHLLTRISVIGSHPQLGPLTLASCRSNVETVLMMLQNGIPSSAAEAPVTALEHARVMAQRGAEVDDTLRFYRLGQGWFMERWTADLVVAVPDRERLLVGVQQTAAFLVEYIDIVSSQVSAEHLAERGRTLRHSAIVRTDVVAALMSGKPVDIARAERQLGHRLDRAQVSFVCWAGQDAVDLEPAAQAVGRALGAARPVLVTEGPRTIAGWVALAPGTVIDQPRLAGTVSSLDARVSVAFGEVAHGLDGFRSSRRQADRARRVGDLSGARMTRFADVAVIDLLTTDLPAAQAFVHAELAGLAAQDDVTEAIRVTVLSVLSPRGGGSAGAARDLNLHRNTVAQRIRRAEVLRGSPLTNRPGELYVALVLLRQLGSAAL